jgi:UDP-N-acetylglucosamine 1-carboxyvinyltransferase
MMRLRVEGGTPLNGHYQPGGNVNAAIALLAASMLTEDESTIENWPDTVTAERMVTIAEKLGAQTTLDGSALTIRTEQILKRELSQVETGGLLFLAPILFRRGYVRVVLDFPLNRIRTHLEALRDLGQDVVVNNGAVEIRAENWAYKDILLAEASVTATGLMLMLAVCYGQETIIRNAASEPHVQELAYAMEGMGAQIHNIGSNVLRVFGRSTDVDRTSLKGITATVGPNHIEVASVAAMAALSGGRVQINGARQEDLRMIRKIYQRLGINLDMDEALVFVPKHADLVVSNREEDVDASIETAPWPGFPSDLVAMATVIATQARGTSLIHEKLYNNRLIFVDKLNAMGAQIVLCDPHRAIVVGATPLHAIYMDTPDVRAGLGMLGAALIAQGETVIDNAQALRYSFDSVVLKLINLGAQITIEG